MSDSTLALHVAVVDVTRHLFVASLNRITRLVNPPAVLVSGMLPSEHDDANWLVRGKVCVVPA